MPEAGRSDHARRERERRGSGTVSAPELRKALQGVLEIPGPSLAYRIILVPVLLVACLVFLSYVALIGGILWAVFGDFLQLAGAIPRRSRGPGPGGVMLLGLVALLFLIKPFLAPRGDRGSAIPIDVANEPLLMECVVRLCGLIGAPTPDRIEIDCQVNASVTRVRESGAFWDRKLILTLGLPLVAGLSLRELSGLLAHELGHFSQRAGTRLVDLLWGINRWLARAVFERDAWDLTLCGIVRTGYLPAVVLGVLLLGMTWIVRGVLWVLLMVCHAFSMAMLREMEFDADRYAIAIGGSRSFQDVMKKTAILELGMELSLQSLREAWRQGRLPDDLPRLVVHCCRRMPEDVRRRAMEERLKRKPNPFDSHPPDRRRMDRALRENAEGRNLPEASAATLFSNFEELARKATEAFYEMNYGPRAIADKLLPVEELVRREEAMQADADALGRFSLGFLDLRHPPFLPDEAGHPSADSRAEAMEFCRAREEFRARVPEAVPILASLRKLEERLNGLAQLEGARRAGLNLDLKKLAQEMPDAVESDEARDQLLRKCRLFRERLEPVRTLFVRSLTLGVRLAQCPGVLREPRDLGRHVACLAALGGAFPKIRVLMDSYSVMGIVLPIFRNLNSQAVTERIRFAAAGWRRILSELQDLLSAASYPFPHDEGKISVARYALEALPRPDDIGDHENKVLVFEDRIRSLQWRLLGRLAAVAEEAEAAVGPPPSHRGPESDAGS